MSKILKMSDRISLKIGDITFKLAPITYMRKQELLSCTRRVSGQEIYDSLKAQALYIKYSLKEIEGVQDYNGNEYKLSFEGDCLTDTCVDEVLNLEQRESLTLAAWQLLNGIKDLKNPLSGDELEGVELKVVSEGN